ncbi:MAG: right-handed parallel beta-helix repeat-containing protein, partial [Deltaproteobacteria bacterium]|nr:right-handed parallel beta-helix repeat-containing protein [Deltaproteobacteria bacterium]
MEGHLYSFDLATGAHRGTYEADGVVNLTAPGIGGGRVSLLPGGASGRLHAVELATGKAATNWPVELPAPDVDASIVGKRLVRSHAVSSLAAVGAQLVFDMRFDDSIDTNKDGLSDQFLMREFVMAVSAADGRVLWQQSNGRKAIDSANDMPKNWLCPTPAIYQGLQSQSTAGQRLARGARTFETASWVAAASTLLPTIQTLDAASGTNRGNTSIAGPTRISPVVANGRLIVGTEGGVVQGNLSSSNQPPDAPTLTAGIGRPVSSVAPTIRWTAALDPNGDAVTYQIRLDRDGEILESREIEVTTGAGETSARLTRNLQPGETYVIAVRARDSKGAWSDWSAPAFVRAVETPAVSVGGTPQGGGGLAAALAAALAGSTVKLGAGTFFLTETMRVPAGVTLEGAGPQQTILDATGQSTGVSLEGGVAGKPTTVKGLTVTGAQVGIAVRDAKDARINNVIVRDNWETGVEVGAAGTAAVTNATLAANGRGVRSFGTVTVRNSIVTGNQTGFVSDHTDAIISRFNDVIGNGAAFQGMVRGPDDIARELKFADYAKRDLRVLRGQASTDQGDPADDFAAEPAPNGGRINLGAFGGTAEAELSAAPALPTNPISSGGGCAVGGTGQPLASGWQFIARALLAALAVVL